MLHMSKTVDHARRHTREVSSSTRSLEDRLQQFYHWRGSLLIFINKFSTILQPSYYNKKKRTEYEFMLYFGVNGKMILDPSATHSFYGPLSTSSSYHVAMTFATEKGMVLKISSMYPRLGCCRAFDACLLSDYPEELEWLVGFVYTRIRKVHTKEKWDITKLPTSTQIRFAFFVTHLFHLHILSLSEDLAEILCFLLDDYLATRRRRAGHAPRLEDAVSSDS